MRTGFTMVEILLATVIVALGILPVLTFFISTGSSLKQTIPYYETVFLAQMGAHEARLGGYEDPYYLGRLTEEGFGTSREPVVFGGHPYFETMEDSAPPWSRIEAGKDWAIQPEIGTLFKLVEPLALELEAEGAPEPKVALTFDWIDKRGKNMTYQLKTPVVSWTPLDRVDGEVTPNPTVSGGQASLDRVIDLGKAAKDVDSEFRTRLEDLESDMENAEASRGMTLALNRIARLREESASKLLGILQEMRKPMENLALGLNPGDLGSADSSLDKRREAVTLVRDALNDFFGHIQMTISSSSVVAGEPRLTMGERLSAQKRILRTAKTACIAWPWPDRSPIRRFVEDLEEYYRGRMPNLAHYFAVEAEKLDSIETTKFYESVKEIRTLREHYTLAVIKLLLY